MSITVNKDRSRTIHRHSRRIEFEGASPILLERRYSHGGKEFIPDEARAGWDHGKLPERIVLEGYVLKKDRSTGQQRATLEYTAPGSQWWGKGKNFADPDAPDWLLELFGLPVPGVVDPDEPTEDMGA